MTFSKRVSIEQAPPDDVTKILIGVTAKISPNPRLNGELHEGRAHDIGRAELPGSSHTGPEPTHSVWERT